MNVHFDKNIERKIKRLYKSKREVKRISGSVFKIWKRDEFQFVCFTEVGETVLLTGKPGIQKRLSLYNGEQVILFGYRDQLEPKFNVLWIIKSYIDKGHRTPHQEREDDIDDILQRAALGEILEPESA